MDILNHLYVYHVQILSILLHVGRIHGQCSGSTATLDVGYSTAIITAPNYPNGYGTNLDCKWLGTTSIAGASVLFRVTNITTSCAGDLINVYDGTSVTGTQIHSNECQVSSGPRTLGYRSATSGNVFLTFTSDSSTSASEIGFKMYLISAQDFSGTGCTSAPQAITATSTEQYLSSPGFPDAYALNLDCTWVITSSSPNAKVKIEFKFLSIEEQEECLWDYLDIIESGSIIEKLCPETWEPTQTYTSSSNSLTLNFHSDGFSLTYRGFLLTYREIDPCDGVDCNDNGNCVFYTIGGGICICNEGWTGEFCQENVCDSINCNNGVCQPPGECVCNPGFSGVNCEIGPCDGVDCNGNGNCEFDTATGVAKCVCDQGWTGEFCAVKKINVCDSINCNDGVCQPPGECVCNPGFSGVNCEIGPCDGVVCNGNGNCEFDTTTGVAKCVCDQGWTGEFCGEHVCDTINCNDGVCVPPGECVCNPGFSGVNCEIGPCDGVDCNGNGTCEFDTATGDAECVCDQGWTGEFCAVNVCDSINCNDGVCQPPGECVCNPGFSGVNCEIGPCDGVDCNGNGTCEFDTTTGIAKCVCDQGWTGEFCAENVCDSINCNNGECQPPGECVCNPGFSGVNCEIGPCDGVDCNGNGDCEFDTTTGDAVCVCDQGWTGEFCAENVCDSINCNDGVCQPPGECVCNPGFSGVNCEIVIGLCKFPCAWQQLGNLSVYAESYDRVVEQLPGSADLLDLIYYFRPDVPSEMQVFDNNNNLVGTVECVEIVDQFIIVRNLDSDRYFCYQITATPGAQPIIQWTLKSTRSSSIDKCFLCHSPKTVQLLRPVTDMSPAPATSDLNAVDCDTPRVCPDCVDCDVCTEDESSTLDLECPVGKPGLGPKPKKNKDKKDKKDKKEKKEKAL